MKIILAFLAGIAITLSITIPRNYENYATAAIMASDRDYWRELASNREWMCRKRGGEFKSSGFSSTFGREPDKINWSCTEFK